MDLLQIAPWICITVEAMKKQHVGQQAEHPVHIGRVPDNRTAAGGLEEFFGETPAIAAFENAACRKIDEIGFDTEAFESVAKRLFIDVFEDRPHFRGPTVKS